MKTKTLLTLILAFVGLARAHDPAGTNSVSITVENGFRVIRANGLPDHTPGAFPNAHNPNSLAPQNFVFRMPLQPRGSEVEKSGQGAWFGVALNGVPFEPGTAEFWNGRREWVMEAKSGFINLGLDTNNAHVQPTGAYHYHGLPLGLMARLGVDGKKKMMLVGWAADGYPIYTSFAYATATDTNSPLRKMASSWRLKSGERPDDAPPGKYDGKFTLDYEFVKGSGDLDECNGRFGATPEFPAGTYYYCITEEFPQLARRWHGEPDGSFFKARPMRAGRMPGPRGPMMPPRPPPDRLP